MKPGKRLSRTKVRRGWVIALLAGVVLAAGVTLRVLALDALQAARPVDPDVRGRIAAPLDGGLSVIELPSRDERRLLSPEGGASVTNVRWSPDGQSIAYGYFHRRPGDPTPSSEIFLIAPTDGRPKVLVERDEPGAQLDFPAWAPDGLSLYFSAFRREGTRFVNRIERFEFASGERTAVLEGYAPAVAPDGRTIVFLRDAREGPELWTASITGENPRRLLTGDAFSVLTSPRFSRDSLTIAFGGASTTQGASPPQWAGILDVPAAFAHGLPSDLWAVPAAGGAPRRLARLGEDDPSVTWAPDGERLAAFGPGGLYILKPTDGDARKILTRGYIGGVDWHDRIDD